MSSLTLIDSNERRRDGRVVADLDVEIHADSGVVAVGRARDMSRTGIYVRTDRDVRAGTRCRVRIRRAAPPIISSMSLWGQVMRSDAEGLGVVFDGSDQELASFVISLFG
ncbi:PilZ domain protein [compost metagenome]